MNEIEGVSENVLPAAQLNKLREEFTALMSENPKKLSGDAFDQEALRLGTAIEALQKQADAERSARVPGLRQIWKMFTGKK